MKIAKRSARYLIFLALCLLGSPTSRSQTNYQFYLPSSVAVDAAGNVYVAETGRHLIHKYDSNGSLVWRVGSMGSAANQFKYPSGIAIDSSNQIYVADTGNARVQKLNSNGATIATWGSYGTAPTQFLRPVAIALDSANRVYVLDAETRSVKKFSNNGAAYLGSWGGTVGTGDGEFGPLGGGPGDIAIDSSGNAYISDTSNQRIQKWTIRSDTTGNITNATFVGWMGRCVSGTNCDIANERSRGFRCTSATCSTSSSGTNGGQFVNPRGLALDSANNMYVADVDNNRIQKFDSAGDFVSAWGSTGDGYLQFRGPIDIATDTQAIYVADFRNGRIVKLSNIGKQLSVLGGGIALTITPGWPGWRPLDSLLDPLDSLRDPSPFFIRAGQTKTATVTVWSLGYFSGNVDLHSTCCWDQLSGSQVTPTGVSTNISPGSVSVLAGDSTTATVTISASSESSAVSGRFVSLIQANSRPPDFGDSRYVAFDKIGIADDSAAAAPCPRRYQITGSTPEVVHLAPLLNGLYDDKEKGMLSFGPTGHMLIGVALPTKEAGLKLDFEKPTDVFPQLQLTEALVVMNNPTHSFVDVMAINGSNSNCGNPRDPETFEGSIALWPGEWFGQMRVSSAKTTTLLFERREEYIAVFAEPNFWTLFGGRKVTITWVGK